MADKAITDQLSAYALHMREHALKMSFAAGSHASHFGAGMSIIEILAVLYGKIMRLDKDNPRWEERDRFILSKGHGVTGYYAALRECGYLTDTDLEGFEQEGSFLMGHPVYNPDHGIEFTNGSLGMGPGLAIGVALAGRMRGRRYRTFVLTGDGELDEGSVWESIMAAPRFSLDRLCLIIDRNRMQLGGNTEEIMPHGDLKRKLEAFGWNTYETDGHDTGALYDIFAALPENGRPSAVIADTVKGKGFSFSENNNAWHHAVLTKDQYEHALEELKRGAYAVR